MKPLPHLEKGDEGDGGERTLQTTPAVVLQQVGGQRHAARASRPHYRHHQRRQRPVVSREQFDRHGRLASDHSLGQSSSSSLCITIERKKEISWKKKQKKKNE